MDHDLVLVLGLALVPLAFVAFVSAWADRRWPVPGLILLAIAAAMTGWAHFTHPGGGYDWRDVPEIALETVARFLR